MSRFCVAGSINIDLVTRTKRFPERGETMQGISFSTFYGGKGANQAVALAKLGADIVMIGKLGGDVYGADYNEYFKKIGVSTAGVEKDNISSGIAVITVEETSENSIIIIAGANGLVDAEYIDKKRELIEKADYLLLQLEIPMEAVFKAAQIAKQSGTTIIFDPAPVPERHTVYELLKLVDIITPNETETEALTGIRPSDWEGFEKAGSILASYGSGTSVMKAGRNGAYLYENGSLTHIKGFDVDAVDTTAAGDTFNAALAYALGEGMNMKDAVCFANAAGAISTTKQGAQDGMPNLEEVKSLLKF